MNGGRKQNPAYRAAGPKKTEAVPGIPGQPLPFNTFAELFQQDFSGVCTLTGHYTGNETSGSSSHGNSYNAGIRFSIISDLPAG